MRFQPESETSSISAFAVWIGLPSASIPSISFSSAGSDGAIRSMTFCSSASVSVRFEAERTASSAQSPFRPCRSASVRRVEAKLLIALRRRSSSRSCPVPVIGVDEPIVVDGAIARMSAACATNTPADVAEAPSGAT